MKVKDILKILEVVEKLPEDMYDIRHYHSDREYDGAYYSDSKNRYIPVRDMDIVHVLRAFKKLNEYKKDARDMYIHMGHIKTYTKGKTNAK
tara:strand:+ start:1176 stop:1448 length:273 start_codon:yes stop_codon:yes gene_type:complete